MPDIFFNLNWGICHVGYTSNFKFDFNNGNCSVSVFKSKRGKSKGIEDSICPYCGFVCCDIVFLNFKLHFWTCTINFFDVSRESIN